MTRQQRRYAARKGPRVPGFIYVPSKNELRRKPETKRNWTVKPSKSDDQAYRKPCGERAGARS